MDPMRQSNPFPGRYSLTQDVTIQAEGGHEMTFDSSLRSSLGQMGDPMFVSTGRKLRKDIEESMTLSQMSVASMQSTSSLGILQLDSMGDLSTTSLQLDGSFHMPRFSDASLDGPENGQGNQSNERNEEMEPGERGNATGIESIESSEIDTEDEVEAVRRENAKRVLYPASSEDRIGLHAGDGGESSGSEATHQSRPGLEGGSSDEYRPSPPFSPQQELSLRQSAEGEVVDPLVPGDGGGGGDGMSDGETESSLTAPSVVSGGVAGSRRGFVRSWSSMSGYSDQERNVEGSVLGDVRQTTTPEMSGLSSHFLLPSMRPKSAGSMTDLPHSPDLRPLSGASSFQFEEASFGSSQEGLHQRFWNSGMMMMDGGVTGEERRGNGTEDEEDQDADMTLIGATGNLEFDDHEDINTKQDILQIHRMMSDFSGFPAAARSSSQGGVYNPFDSMQNNAPQGNVHDEEFPEYDGKFIAQADVEAVLEEDQREFEKEHEFREDEYISSDQYSDHGTSRWTPPDKSHVTLGSPGANNDDECFDERVSLGEFMRTRTEALGSLSGDHGIKRPSFGTGHIKTPEGREPVALMETSRLSLVTEEQGRDGVRLQGVLEMGDLGESIRFAGVGSDTEEQHEQQNKSASQPPSQLVEDSLTSWAKLDGYSAGKVSMPMASLYFRAPEGSAVNDESTSEDPQMTILDLEDLSLADNNDGDCVDDSNGVSRFRRVDDDVNNTPRAETLISQTLPSTSPSKPNLKVQPFQEVTPMIPRQVVHLREESEPDGTKTPPIATSSIAAAIINASSTTKPEEFAAMIVALSNKNRKMKEAPSADPRRAEPMNKPKSVDVHFENASPRQLQPNSLREQRCDSNPVLSRKQELYDKPSVGNIAELSGRPINLPASNKSRNAVESHPDSDGRYGTTRARAEPEFQLPRMDKFPTQKPLSYQSHPLSQIEIQEGICAKSTDSRMRSPSRTFEKSVRNDKSRDGVKVRSKAHSEPQLSSTIISSTSEKQKTPRESADSSILKELAGMELSFDSKMKIHAERIKVIQRDQDVWDETLQAGGDSSESWDSDTLLWTPRPPQENHERILSKPQVGPQKTNGLAKKLSSGYQKNTKGRTKTGPEKGNGRETRVSPKIHRSEEVSSTATKTGKSKMKDPEKRLYREAGDLTGKSLKEPFLQSSQRYDSSQFQDNQRHGNIKTQLRKENSPKSHDGATRGSACSETAMHGNILNRDFSSDDEDEDLPRMQQSWNECHSSRQPDLSSSKLEPEGLSEFQRRDQQINVDCRESLVIQEKKVLSPLAKQGERTRDDQSHGKTQQDAILPARSGQSLTASPDTTPSANKSPASLYSASSSLSESATQTSDDDTTNAPSVQMPKPQPSQSFGPPIQSFQVFPKDQRASNTPTLLTSQSLLTDALLKQYLNEQAVTSRLPSTLSVAPSYISGQLMKSLDVVQTGTSVTPAVVGASTMSNVAPRQSSNLGLTQTLPSLTINTGEGGPCPNQLQSLGPSYPPISVAGAHPLLTSTRDLGPMLDRVSIPGQISSLDSGVSYPPPYPTSATMPVVPLQSNQGSVLSMHAASVHGYGSLSATSYAALPTHQGAPFASYPMTVVPSRPGTAQDHGPPQPTRLNAPIVNPVEVNSINIKGVCCIGIAKQAILPLKNPGPRWLQCHLEMVSVSLNGEELPPDSLSSFLVKRRAIISPQNSEDIKVVFVPHQPGIYVAQVMVSSSPVVADGEVAYLGQGGVPVTIIARAEKPSVGVKGAQNGTLDLGVLSYGKERSAPIYLINQGSSTVPLRLLIKVNSSAWHSFYLHTGDSKANPDSLSGLNLPSHITLEGSNDTTTLWVHFRACQRDKAGSVAAPEQVSAKLEVWLDIPEGGALPITSVILRATVGLAKLNIPRALTKEISLRSNQGEHVGRKLPLKNTGNIHLDLELNVVSAQGLFSAVPQAILLSPGQEVDALIKYTPKEVPSLDTGQLTMCARPDGPSYEVMLRGEAVEKSLDSSKPRFLVNRHYISWGGVPIGRALQQKLTIRSCSKTEVLKLKLYITENKQDFQLLNPFKTGEWSTDDNQYVTLQPFEDLPVHILFSPTAVATSQAKLNIKPQASNFKYTVPLSGYGGVSKLVIESGRETQHGLYSVSVGQVSAKCNTVCTVTVSNTGRRSAFVKALGFQDEEGKDKVLSSQLQVEPAEFILQAKTRKQLTIRLAADGVDVIQKRPGTVEGFLAGVGLFYGDEISRQQHRRALRHKDSEAVSLSEHNPLLGISFDLPIPGESKVNEVCDLPWRSGDLNLFYRCISRLMLHLTGYVLHAEDYSKAVTTASLSPVKTTGNTNKGTKDDAESGSSSTRQMTVPNTPPVKGTPAPRHTVIPVSSTSPPGYLDVMVGQSSSVSQANANRTETSWSVQPQQLLLTAPGADLGVQKSHSIRLANHTVRHLRFETMHTPDCLIVTPAAGVVEPTKQLFVLVSCNPSIRSKGVQLPWSGTILVVCDGLQKEVKVQIREDFGMDTSVVPSMRRMQSLPDQPVTPDSSMVAPLTEGTSPVKLLSKVVRFPSTKVGSTSEATLEFQNNTRQSRQWCLSSFAPTYVKQSSGEVYRATYSAFRFTRQFGNLEPGQNIAVHLEFIPRDEGAYSQYWDLESSDRGVVAKSSHKTRIELMGVGDVVHPAQRSKKTKTDGLSEDTLIAVQPQGISKHTAPAHLTTAENTSEGDVSPEEVKTQDGKLSHSPDSKTVQGVVLIHDHLVFSKTKVGSRSTLKIQVQNTSKETHTVKFLSPQPPFSIRHFQHTIPPNRFIRLPVTYKPTTPGRHQAALIIQTEGQHKLLSKLEGTAESD